MSRYHRSSNPCFAGSCPVLLADGTSIPISNLRPGDSISAPIGPRTVAAVVRTDPHSDTRKRGQLCRIDDLWVTPWHPCLIGGKWTFPAYVAKQAKECNEPVYSVLLEQDEDPNAHVIDVAGVMCVTLGHGVTNSEEGKEDVRAHAFFGDYQNVARSLEELDMDSRGHLRCDGVEKDDNGLACTFVPADATTLRMGGEDVVMVDSLNLQAPAIPTIVVAAA